MIALTTEVSNISQCSASPGGFSQCSQNGPIHLQPNGSWFINQFSWNTLADTIWIDQPVGKYPQFIYCVTHLSFTGTGFSTSDSKGYGTHSAVKIPELIAISCHLA
jgi:hypothetical protein